MVQFRHQERWLRLEDQLEIVTFRLEMVKFRYAFIYIFKYQVKDGYGQEKKRMAEAMHHGNNNHQGWGEHPAIRAGVSTQPLGFRVHQVVICFMPSNPMHGVTQAAMHGVTQAAMHGVPFARLGEVQSQIWVNRTLHFLSYFFQPSCCQRRGSVRV